MRVPLLPLLVVVPFLCHGVEQTEKISSKRLFVFGKGSGAHDWVRRIKIQIPVEFTLRELESRIQSRSKAWDGASLALCATLSAGRLDLDPSGRDVRHWLYYSTRFQIHGFQNHFCNKFYQKYTRLMSLKPKFLWLFVPWAICVLLGMGLLLLFILPVVAC